MIRELEKKVVAYGSVDYTPGHEVVERCFYDAKRRLPSHNEYCHSHAGWRDDEYIDPDRSYYCGIKEQLEHLEEVSKLKAAPLWSATLDNPLLAAGNSLFPVGVVKSSSEIREEISTARDSGHIRGLAQIKFTGLRVVWPEDEPGFLFTRTCCIGVLLSCLGVLGFRVAYGDWGTAYTAGAYYVALAGIVLAWFGRQGIIDILRK
ncbi:hypothetical protein K456DRAFT_1756981 [Colletotrichum gloeosporioides 23]|nr:hypothetical protein K456DRAFT_1756981 [Colletotrichum gloeosporioides 23]